MKECKNCIYWYDDECNHEAHTGEKCVEKNGFEETDDKADGEKEKDK